MAAGVASAAWPSPGVAAVASCDGGGGDSDESDVSDDDLKGGGKHRKRRRQNDWRWAIVCGLLFLAFVFYEEILDAAVGMCAMSLPGVTRLVYTWTLPYWL